MNNLDLIKQYVDTGLQIPEYQIYKLNNNLKKTYIRKRLISTENDDDLSAYEVELLQDSDKNKYLHGLSRERLESLLRHAKTTTKQDRIIDYYITNDLLSSDDGILSVFMQYYSDVDKLINIILEKYINRIGASVISTLVAESTKDSDFIISKILNNEHSLSQIKPKTMDYMLSKSSNPIKTIQLFLNLRKDLNSTDVTAFLLQGMDKYYNEDFVSENFLIYFKDTITDDALRSIIKRSTHGNSMVKIMNKIFGVNRINRII